MPIYDDSLEIRLASPDYQQDWGVVGDPNYATLNLYRRQAGMLELQVAADSPVRDLLMREGCAVQVKFRGRTEFLGHIYLRQGGMAPDSPVTVFARSEDEVFDQTLAWVMPHAFRFSPSFGGLYSSGRIEPGQQADSAQAFPDPWLDPGHYMWSIPWQPAAQFPDGSQTVGGWWLGPGSVPIRPQLVGSFLASIMDANLGRVGYTRGALFADTVPASSSQSKYLAYMAAGVGAPQKVIADDALDGWADSIDPVPWVSSFSGFAPRFQTLREVATAFQDWADEHYEQSFNLFSDGVIEQGAFGVRVGFRPTEPRYPVPLTVTAGTVVDGSWSVSDHTGSRIILGGPGEQEARLFQERRQPDREGLGRVIEVFKDATGAKLMADNKNNYEGFPREYFVDPAVNSLYQGQARQYFDQQGARYLAESASETSIEVELQESGEIYYGGESGYRLGQLVTIDLGWIEFEKRIERVTVSFSNNDGLTVTPMVGSEVSSSDEAAARAMRALANAQRRNQSER